MKTLGIDIGTTTISAVIVENGKNLAQITYKNDSFLPAGNSWERIQSPEYIRETALEAVKTLIAKHPEVIDYTAVIFGEESVPERFRRAWA